MLSTYLWHPVGVDQAVVTRGWHTPDGVPSDVIMQLAKQDQDTTVAEDVKLVNAAVQHGLNNRGYRPGPLIIDPNYGVNSEHSIRALHDWVREALAG